MSNLAKLIESAARAVPDSLFGTIENPLTLSDSVKKAAQLAAHMDKKGYKVGSLWAVIGNNSTEYMLTWMAAQFAGVQLALLNPDYPDELIISMLDDLQPQAIVWLDRTSFDWSNGTAIQINLREWWDEQPTEIAQEAKINIRTLPGMKCDSDSISAYIHTSGTTGRPKLCALSHDYFLRLGRFFADSMCLGKDDKVFAPLSMYHINPLGYGLIGSLTAKASILSTRKFSASKFWIQVKENNFSALILHPSISIILATASSPEDVKNHNVRISFAAETLLCGLFNIPVGVCGFGSTESAGLSHSWHFRAGDMPMCPEGISNYAGRARYDVDWKIDEESGEILVQNKGEGQAILSGYIRNGLVQSALDENGWFHTGDRGRKDKYGNLVFIERLSEAIRVKGEYVPIDFVESKLTRCRSLAPFALWRKDNESTGHEVQIYTESTEVDLDEVRTVIKNLPRFMQPLKIVRIEQLPRVGANKVARNKLFDLPELDVISL
jgi:crotonobetaine/carnitine-CoA ligase